MIYKVIQHYLGVVDVVKEETFTAVMTSVTDCYLCCESMEFSYSELSDADKTKVKKGAVFEWKVVHKDIGTKRRTVSEIWFKKHAQITTISQMARLLPEIEDE